MTDERRPRIDQPAQIHLSQRDDEARVDRQQQHEIEFADADEFWKAVRSWSEKKVWKIC